MPAGRGSTAWLHPPVCSMIYREMLSFLSEKSSTDRLLMLVITQACIYSQVVVQA